MIEKYQDCTREWSKETKALKKMTDPEPYRKDRKLEESPARKI